MRAAKLPASARVLLVTPGVRGASLLPELLNGLSAQKCVAFEASRTRLANLSARTDKVLGRATRLPFIRHSFDAVLSVDALYSIRPPWTVLAEYHRVLVPDGKLVLIEQQSHGVFSALRDRISGPGKRIFSIDEIRYRMARSDYAIESLNENVRATGVSHPLYCVVAIKKENPVEPVPQFQTAREMIARRKNKFPAGEELP
jgi:SAM-dependent methyltransferase